ncbi:MAG: TonB-dependent receptor [Bacteroidia bacterium]|nr:MAG: TonB-dependent receptor [Bacteroidia bacterium]
MFLGAWTTASAQNAVLKGYVRDQLTGERIPYANVILAGTPLGTAANDVGFFLIDVPPGRYSLRVSAVGYSVKDSTIHIDAVRAFEANIALTPTAIETDEVVVDAHLRTETTADQPSVHFLERSELTTVPATSQPDVLQSLGILPGVVSTSDVSSKFHVRGGSGDQNLVLLDGIKIFNPFHALGLYSVFDPDIVRHVRVHTGSFGVEYGGRLSSVITIQSRTGREDRFSAQANVNFLSTKLQMEGPVANHSSFFLSARRSVFSRTISRLTHTNLPLQFYDVFAKATFESESGVKIDILGLLTDDRLAPGEEDYPHFAWSNQVAGLTVSGLLSDRLFTQASVFTNGFTHTQTTSSAPTTSSVAESGVRAQATYYAQDRSLYYFGFEFTFPVIEYIVTNNLGERVRLYSIPPEASIWAGYEDTFKGGLTLSAGLRGEVGSMFRRGFRTEYLQPRITVAKSLTATVRAKISYGRITQNLATLTNEDDVISIVDPWIEVPQYLRSQIADHWVAGVDWQAGLTTAIGIEVYAKRFSSLLVYNRRKVDELDPDYISGKGIAYGVECLLRTNPRPFDFSCAYSLSWVEVNNLGLTYPPRYDRRHSINVVGTWTVSQGLSVTARWQFGSGFPYTQTNGSYYRLTLKDAIPGPFYHETGELFSVYGKKNAARLPSYHRLDAGVSYEFSVFGSFEGALNITLLNMYDNKNILYFDRKRGSRVDNIGFFPSASLTLGF